MWVRCHSMALFNRPHANSYRLSVPTVSMLHRLKDTARYWSKIFIFRTFYTTRAKTVANIFALFFSHNRARSLHIAWCLPFGRSSRAYRQAEWHADRQTDGKAMSIVQRTTWDYIAHCSLLTLSTSVNTSELTATWLQCVYFGFYLKQIGSFVRRTDSHTHSVTRCKQYPSPVGNNRGPGGGHVTCSNSNRLRPNTAVNANKRTTHSTV